MTVIPFPRQNLPRSQEIGITERLALDEHKRLLEAFTEAVCKCGSSAMVRRWSAIIDQAALEMSNECLLRTEEEGML